MDKGVQGFSCTGLFPFNPDVFGDEDFAPSLTTEIANVSNISTVSGNSEITATITAPAVAVCDSETAHAQVEAQAEDVILP